MLFLVPLIAFFGYIAGFLLKKYIPEEQKDAKPYVFWAEKIILLLILSYLVYSSFSLSILSVILFSAGLLVGFFLKEIYLYLGLAILSLEFLPTVLVFLFGLVKGEKHIIKNALFFFLPFLILLGAVPFEYTKLFAAGGICIYILRRREKCQSTCFSFRL